MNTPFFGWLQIVRLGLVPACLGAVVVVTTSTLNRIMVVELALPALLPSLTRKISSAFSKLPSASVKAFLHSIMGASVLARNSATMLAVIAIFKFFLSVYL